jgi:O-antigen/teichoic acid export membrane protein
MSAVEDSHSFLHRASFWVMLENIVKVLEPALTMACLKVFAGGEWGAFKVFEAVLLIGMRIICLGLERGLIWQQAQGSDEEHRRAFWQTISFMIVWAAVLCAGAYGVAFLGRSVLPDPARYGYSSTAILVYGVAMLLQALIYPATQFLVSRGVLHFNLLSRFVCLPLGAYGGALCLRAMGVGRLAIPLAYLFGCGLGAVVAFYGVFRYVPGIWKAFTLRPLPPLPMLRFSAIISSSEIAMAMAARLDIYLLTNYYGLRAVEVYTTIVMVVNALRTIRQSFDNILLGLFSRMAKAADSLRALVEVYQQSNARVMHLHLPVMVALIAYGGLVLGWLIPHGGGHAQLPLTVGLILVFLSTPFALCLQWQVGLGRSWMMPIGQALFVSLNAGLNMLLIPRLGIVGGVIASGVAQISGGIPAWVVCQVQSRGRLHGIGFWRPLFPAAVWLLWLAIHFVFRMPWLDVLVLLALLWARWKYSLGVFPDPSLSALKDVGRS